MKNIFVSERNKKGRRTHKLMITDQNPPRSYCHYVVRLVYNSSYFFTLRHLTPTTVNLKRLTFCFLLVAWNQVKYLWVEACTVLIMVVISGCGRQNIHRRDLIPQHSKLPRSITAVEPLGKFHGFQWYFPFSRLVRDDESVEFAFQNSFFRR